MDQDDLAMITDGLERILSQSPLEAIDRAGGVGGQAAALWMTLQEAGYPDLCIAETHGGFGGSFADTAGVAQAAARNGAALPLADSIIAGGFLSACGIEVPNLRIGLSDPLDPSSAMPHAGQVDAALQWHRGHVRLIRIGSEAVTLQEKAEDGAGFVDLTGGEVIINAAVPDWLSAEVFHAVAAFVRSANMAGAMEAALALTLSYTQEREQFGRPLAKFQAIQHHLSDIACETAAAIAAVEMASDALAADPHCGARAMDEIAIAKIRCGEAASRVAASAHQAHGAMGFTREYALGRYTRRLWQWQDEFGSDVWWAAKLGHRVLAETPCSLWPRISQAI